MVKNTAKCTILWNVVLTVQLPFRLEIFPKIFYIIFKVF